MPERLCYVEDDPSIRRLVSDRLVQNGFIVEAYESADSVVDQIATGIFYDLYILDILLPGEKSGLDLCRELRRKNSTLPILVLSALSEPSQRIEGLRVGADDYLTKPFEIEELLLRIRGMLKRRSWYGHLPEMGSEFAWDENRINFVNFEAHRGKQKISLTQKEAMLMKLLIERESTIVTRDEILDRVWGYEVFPSSRTVDNFIVRLRRYFEAVPSEPKHIHSVRGMGYKFTTKAVS